MKYIFLNIKMPSNVVLDINKKAMLNQLEEYIYLGNKWDENEKLGTTLHEMMHALGLIFSHLF